MTRTQRTQKTSLRRINLRQSLALKRAKVGMLLDGLQDVGNIGSIMRLTNAFATEGTYYLERQQLFGMHKSAVGTQHFETLERIDASQLETFLSKFDKIIAIDNKVAFKTKRFEEMVFHRDSSYLFILGNESNGISLPLLRRADTISTITQYGCVGSLNVAVAAAIVLYEYRKQIGSP